MSNVPGQNRGFPSPPPPPGAADRRIVELEGLEGATSLARLLDTLHRRGHRLPVHVAIYIVHELARALRHLHDKGDPRGRPLGRVHGSVSAHNVLLLRSGRVKLVARSAVPAHGDRSADLQMLGLVAWEMLVGWPPPDAAQGAAHAPPVPPSALRPGLPAQVDAVVVRALDRRPGHRCPSAGTLAGDTARFLATRPDPRRGLRLLLNEVIDGAPSRETSAVTQLTRVPWRDGSGAARAVPPPPPTPPAPIPVQATRREPFPTLGLRAHELVHRPRLRRAAGWILQTMVAALLALGALLALEAGRGAGRGAPVPAPPPSGAVIVPISERTPPEHPSVLIEVSRARHR